MSPCRISPEFRSLQTKHKAFDNVRNRFCETKLNTVPVKHYVINGDAFLAAAKKSSNPKLKAFGDALWLAKDADLYNEEKKMDTAPSRRHSKAYNLFTFILIIISLVIMVVMLLPLNEATIGLLQFYDNLICAIFLVDFFFNLITAPKKSDYFVRERGWLDLLGSIPSLGVAFKYSGLFRLARLNRLARIRVMMRGTTRKELISNILKNRSRYTAFITILLLIIVLATASVLVLEFESRSPGARITTGWDAFWYSMVTITTVGYGDYYPVTTGGRITAMFIMVTGVGLIGVLASLLSNLMMGSQDTSEVEERQEPALAHTSEQELAAIKNELAEMRQLLDKIANEVERKQ